MLIPNAFVPPPVIAVTSARYRSPASMLGAIRAAISRLRKPSCSAPYHTPIAFGSYALLGSRRRSSAAPGTTPATTSCRPSKLTPTTLVLNALAAPIVPYGSRSRNSRLRA
jgi:hypothetical protein